MDSKQLSSSQPFGFAVSDLALLTLALMWGTSHVITKSILANHSPAFYTSIRFGLASICFVVMFSRHLRVSNASDVLRGTLLGVCSFAGIGLYVAGLSFTQASKAGFITGLYLPFTPILSYALFKAKPSLNHLAGLGIAVLGFVLLSFPTRGERINWGDVLVLLAAIAWATHIAATSAFARDHDVRTLAAVQVMTVALLAYLAFFLLNSLGLETQPNPIDGKFAAQIAYMAVMVTFVAALVQTWAQGKVSSTHAVIFYALEPVTAAVFAYLMLGERLSWRGSLGAALILLGVSASKLGLATRLLPRRTPEEPPNF